jgi:hypothetical protein
MSLPACQQRAIDRMEGVLRASEPRLTSMFAIFARLNDGEPVNAETLNARRRRLLQPGNGMYAILLIPVMFIAVIVGAVIGGGARGTITCDVGYPVGGGAPALGRAMCPAAGEATAGKTTIAKTSPGHGSVSCEAASPAGAAGQVPGARFVTRTGGEHAFSRPSRADTTTADMSGMC